METQDCGSIYCGICHPEFHDPEWDIVWPGEWVTLNGEPITFEMLELIVERV